MRRIVTLATLFTASLLPLTAQAMTPVGAGNIAARHSASQLHAAADSQTCKTPVTNGPTGPATVSTKSSPYGNVLAVGSGTFAGCSLYILTSDTLRAMTTGLAPFACSDNPNVIGPSCDGTLWPALLTKGRPIAGKGVKASLLGTVTRTDVLSGKKVVQVTYGGLPLYRFFLDEDAGEMDGANLFDPVTSPTGTWYLVNPSHGLPAVGRAHLQVETVGNANVVSASMDDHFSLLPHGSFPVYTLSTKSGHQGACDGICALKWQPVLTAGPPTAAGNINQHALGFITRSDGNDQVTYNGKPLYLFIKDAYIPTVTGAQSINGSGWTTRWGVFNTISMP